MASPHPRGLVGTPLGTGHAGALATVALDHAQPRGCAMAVGVLWAGWGTTAATLDPCGPPQAQPHSHTHQGRCPGGWVGLGWCGVPTGGVWWWCRAALPALVGGLGLLENKNPAAMASRWPAPRWLRWQVAWDTGSPACRHLKHQQQHRHQRIAAGGSRNAASCKCSNAV